MDKPKPSIHEILSNPDSLARLSDTELKQLLAPYIPEARKALLPQEKASKLGMDRRTMQAVLQDPTIMAGLAKLREAREKGKI